MILYNVLLFTNTSNRIISILQYIRPIIKSLPLMTNLQGEWQAFSYAPVGKNFICFIYLQSTASTADLVWANTIDTPRWKLYRYFSITEESLAYENQQLMLESIFNFITQTFSAFSSTSEISQEKKNVTMVTNVNHTYLWQSCHNIYKHHITLYNRN